MDRQGETMHAEAATRGATPAACRVLIAVPFYKNEHLVAPLLNSLVACAADLNAAGAELICYNDSPAYAPLASCLAEFLPVLSRHFVSRVETNTENLGFVRTMNRAVAEAVARRADLLLLNSDTVMEPGALPELLAVAALDHMIGFVNPRSNNATITTLPLRAHPAPRAPGARARYQALAERLPRFSFVPTAVGFCLLIRWAILAEFGGFDEIYGQGYNEENDLVMRAGRCGYRAVLANHAFVWHEGEQSFAAASSTRALLEPRNRAILDARYPEYSGATQAYYHTPEAIAEQILAKALPDGEGRLDIAFDFSSFRAAHNGTFEAGRQLLRHASQVWGEGFRIHVLCDANVYAFHDYAPLGIARADPHGGQRFAAIFRVGQPYDWNVLERLAPAGAVLGIYMLDTISIDCPPLASPLLYDMWQFTLDHADIVATQSEQTRDQFRRRFRMPPGAREIVSYHALDLAEYRLPGAPGGEAAGTGRILVLGNHFHHKYLNPTANALAAAFPDRAIVAMGPDFHGARGVAGPLDPPPFASLPNLHIVEVGALSTGDIGAAYEAADLVVFPSHAEGFGFPLLHALAARRPVFVRRLPVFAELHRALGHTPNVHFYDTTTELIECLRTPPGWAPHAPPPAGDDAARSAREIRDALMQALARVDYWHIVRRVRAVQLPSALAAQHGNARPTASDTKAAEAARYLATRVERLALRVLQMRRAYAAIRLAFRAGRSAWRKARGR